jgi:prolyl-tRNA synthetase
MSKDVGITVKKFEDFSEWYTQIVIKTELADYAPLKGFMVLKPYGYSIWEKISSFVDCELKKLGHKNAYFPALIPESFLKKEAEHFKGFSPEVFWVTHAGDDALTERLAIRPTSETIAYVSYAKWIKSWRDLPLLLNFWNSVLRAEIKSTKPFLRTSEFLWQEGHTVHATKEEADKEVMVILNLYKRLIEDCLAIPTLAGYKSDKEKFVGALYTATLESLMPDGKALQMATSHNLGENFSKAFEIKYVGKDEQEHYAWNTCWAISWRLIGALIMVHGDDKGLVLPPKIAPTQIVIVPIFYSEEDKVKVLTKAKNVFSKLKKAKLSVELDDRPQYTPGWKFNEWEMRGIPLRIEIGPKDVQNNQVVAARRDSGEKIVIKDEELTTAVRNLLKEIQKSLFEKARKFLEEHITIVRSYDEFKKVLEEKGGFIKACWCSSDFCEEKIKEETGATIRLIPFEKQEIFGSCIYCGKEANKIAYFAKSY